MSGALRVQQQIVVTVAALTYEPDEIPGIVPRRWVGSGWRGLLNAVGREAYQHLTGFGMPCPRGWRIDWYNETDIGFFILSDVGAVWLRLAMPQAEIGRYETDGTRWFGRGRYTAS